MDLTPEALAEIRDRLGLFSDLDHRDGARLLAEMDRLTAERDRAIAAELRRLAGALDTARREARQDSHDPVSAGKARGYSGAISVLTARAAELDPDDAVTRVADAIADVVTTGREVLDPNAEALTKVSGAIADAVDTALDRKAGA